MVAARALLPLLPVAEDAERRDRGITLERWLDAPPPPRTVAECVDSERPCAALRCQFHLGERGDRSFSCQLDFVELPDEERTFERIAKVLGVTQERVVQIARHARDRAPSRVPRDVLISLGVRHRNARQP